jgi:site-specific DNA-methyltransferase (adenine-specific)/site-specific DNA-methyltransferase (cytosine-N4-specific)
VFLFSKSEKYFYDADSAMEDSLDGSSRKNRRSVWNINTEGFKGAHFAVFPPELVELCVLSGSSRGSSVLDPFFGTGTVGAVSEQLDRKCVGIEMKPEFAEMAVSRIESARQERSLPLF